MILPSGVDLPAAGVTIIKVRTAVVVILACLVAGAVGFGVGRAAQPAVEPVRPAEPLPVPGERGLELAEVKQVVLRLSATDRVSGQIAEAEATIRQRLAAVGIRVVSADEPHQALVWAHLDSHHFKAYDAHGVATELHLSADHKVNIGGQIRVIPHDLWQANTTRLVQPELVQREVVQATDELAQYLVAAIRRSRKLGP